MPPAFLSQNLVQRIAVAAVAIPLAVGIIWAGGWILAAYLVSQAAVLVLAYTLYRIELSGKRLDARLRARRGAYA